jgi:LacI family transcriptional regulator
LLEWLPKKADSPSTSIFLAAALKKHDRTAEKATIHLIRSRMEQQDQPKMTNIIEVARHAGVSTATVSNVIRGTQRVSPRLQERVKEAIRKLDYHPNELARSLKVKQTRMLGMVIPDITNPFFPEMMRGAEDLAFDRGYFITTANTDDRIERERKIIYAMRSYRVDGILLASTSARETSHVRAAVDANTCVVCIDRKVRSVKTDAVLLDNVRGSREAITHLIESGHRRIALISGPLELQSARERLRGYEQGLREAGIKPTPSLTYEGDFRSNSGYHLGKKILSRHIPPSAILISNGPMAIGFLRALEELKLRSPEDVALVTFDNISFDHLLQPHLTSVVQPSYEIGAKATNMLIDRIEGKLTGSPVIIRIRPTLIIRESSQARTVPRMPSKLRQQATAGKKTSAQCIP